MSKKLKNICLIILVIISALLVLPSNVKAAVKITSSETATDIKTITTNDGKTLTSPWSSKYGSGSLSDFGEYAALNNTELFGKSFSGLKRWSENSGEGERSGKIWNVYCTDYFAGTYAATGTTTGNGYTLRGLVDIKYDGITYNKYLTSWTNGVSLTKNEKEYLYAVSAYNSYMPTKSGNGEARTHYRALCRKYNSSLSDNILKYFTVDKSSLGSASNDRVKNAMAWAKAVKNGQTIKVETESKIKEYTYGGKTYYGPFKVTYNYNNSTLLGQSVTVWSGSTQIKGKKDILEYSDGKYYWDEDCTIESGHSYYICTGTNREVTFTLQYKFYRSRLFYVTQNYGGQDLMFFAYQPQIIKKSKTVKWDDDSKASIEIEKTFTQSSLGDKNTDAESKLGSSGKVTFDITFDAGISGKITTKHNSITVTGGGSSQKKSVSIGNDRKIMIENISGTGTITVKETKTLSGYEMANTVKFTIAEDGKGGYKVSKIKGAESSSITNGNGLAKIDNKMPDERTIIVKKVDEEGNAIPGIKFKLTISPIASCTIGSKTYTANASGVAEIASATTDSKGKIKIKINDDDLTKTITVKAEELSNSLYDSVTVTKNLKFTEDTEEKTITITNSPKPFDLTLQKKDKLGNKLGSGYKFVVTIDNGKSIVVNSKYIDKDHHTVIGSGNITLEGKKFYLVTDSNGQIVINKINAKSIESDITIREYSVGNLIFTKIPTTTISKEVTSTGSIKFTSEDTNTVVVSGGTLNAIETNDDITLDLTKVDASDENNTLDGAKFKVTIKAGSNTIYGPAEVTTNELGKILQEDTVKFNTSKYLNQNITVLLEELEPPRGYSLPDDPNYSVVFRYKYTNNNNIAYVVSEANNCEASFSGKTLKVKITNGKHLNLQLSKADSLDNAPVNGAVFNIKTEGVKEYYYNDTKVTSNNSSVTTDSGGVFQLSSISPAKGASQVKITVTETDAPNGLALMEPNPVIVVWKKNAQGQYELDKSNSSSIVAYDEEDNRAIINAIDKNAIEEFNLAKIDSVTLEKLPGAQFKLSFDNIEKLKVPENCVVGAGSSNKYIEITKSELASKTFVTNSDGLIPLKDIILTSKQAKLEVKEVKRPDAKDNSYYYKETDKPVYFDFNYTEYGKEENGIEVTGPYLADGTTLAQGAVKKEVTELVGTTKRNYSLDVDFKNVPLMDLKGQVWLDEQQASKDARPRDGVNNDSSYLPKVNVYLFEQRSGEARVIKNIQTSGEPDSNSVDYSTNSSSGKYEFIELESPRADYRGQRNTTLDGYIVKFEYNGIDYEDTIENKDSDAFEYSNEDEFARDVFNSRFKTIGYEPDSLGYRYYDGGADLLYNHGITNNEYHIWGENPTNRDRNFKVRAKTELQTGTDNSLDFGMVERFFDLAISNTIEKVHYAINGKSWDDNQGGEAEAPETNKYNTSMFYSDYNYRFDDYSTDLTEESDRINNGDEESILNRDDILKGNTELQVQVKYKLRVVNQVAGKGVDNVVVKYTYPAQYYALKDVQGGTVVNSTTGEVQISLTGNEITEGIYLVFELVKDSDRNLPLDILSDSGLIAKTTAEIMSYTTTEGGYIDQDSEPGNGKEEDDIQSTEITFKIKDEVREISGNVAEAVSGNSQELSSTNINDVIVQLIEIVHDDNNNNNYEYIWQETRTGSDTVKARDEKSPDGTGTYTYNVTVNAGEYKFQGREFNMSDSHTGDTRIAKAGFIPGNYIVRFIYGDGTTYDYNPTTPEFDLSNIATKYNGQDYKSTIDAQYREEWYTNNNANESKARDNEGRRLQVMAYSTTMNGALGEALNTVNYDFGRLSDKQKELLKEYYNNTLRNDVAVAQYINNVVNHDVNTPAEIAANDQITENQFTLLKTYVLYKTWMCAETSKLNVSVETSVYEHVNLGLTLRPRTQLTLEKHLTGLKITPSGVGAQSVVDAKVDNLEDVLQGNPSITTTGTNNHLQTFLSTRGNRGSWYVQTDTDELMRGGQVEAQYTYVIRNTSEADYLSSYLVAQYESGIESGAYITELTNKSNEVKNAARRQGQTNIYGTYLGTNYYTGNVGTDAQVPSRVNIIEEALNNDFKFTEKDGTNFVAIGSSERIVYNSGGIAKNPTPTIDTVIRNRDPYANFLVNNGNFNDSTDYSKTVTLVSTLNPGNPEIALPSYIAEIIEYTNAAGRRDTESTPGNLEYVHSEDNEMTLDAFRYTDGGAIHYGTPTATATNVERLNEVDEFWAETIIVSKPTGEDKAFPVTLVAVISSSVILLGAGIILIKKYAIKK